MSTNKIMNDVLRDYRDKRPHPKALAAAMRKLGWEQGQKKGDGGVVRGYKRPVRQEDEREPEV